MQKPPIPFDEILRLKALHALNVLDTPREERFDRILRLATRLFNVPMAAISLVDGDRQWFKSLIGIEVEETSREISFCGHAILGDQAMIVPDALRDTRFRDNPLVTAGPEIRFYAGHPLKLAGGRAVGALCLLDKQPRNLDQDQLASLADLAAMVEKELGAERVPELYTRITNAEAETHIARAAKHRFLSNITHELRTPMNGVLGMCQLLMDGRLDAEQREGLGIIKESSETFLTVIDDLLDFTNLEIGAAIGRSERFNPVDALREAVRPFSAECARKSLRLVTDIADDIPAGLIGDVGRVRQILVNLVGNAVQFTRKGMVRVEAQWIPTGVTAGDLLIRIKDSGPGIRSEKLADLFIGYSAKDGTPHGADAGGGLGLAITKRLVDSMHGTIQVTSIPGKGSNFTVKLRLPIDPDTQGCKALPPAQAPRAAEPDAPPDGQAAADADKPPVLLVEDNAINLKVAKRMLEKLGMRVDTAGTGVEALNLVARHGYSAIFMDCQMPDMDGYEATRNIRGSNAPWSGLPIIALTAFASPKAREECLQAGMDDHIGKPVRFAALESAVNRYVRR